MKTTSLTLLFLSNYILCQTWFPIGAKWYFNYPNPSYPNTSAGYIKFCVIKDTIIHSATAKLLEKTTVNYNGSLQGIQYHIVKENNGKVFYLDTLQNDFKLMYDFSLNVGDTFNISVSQIQSMCDSVSPFIVTDIYDTLINGICLKIQAIKGILYINPAFGGQPEERMFWFIEKIGYPNIYGSEDLLLFSPYCAALCSFLDPFYYLRCYSDHEIHYTKSDYYLQCDFTNLSALKNDDINIYYENNFIIINSFEPINSIEITDIYGRKILISNFNKNECKVNVSELANGVYVMSIKGKDFQLIKKILK